MLSILIPIYNYDVLKLVTSLKDQCIELEIPFEITCYDDFSKEKFRKINRALDSEFGVSYIELSENKGRSKIRNMLVQNARYEHILLIDCDSKITNKNFIKSYIYNIDIATLIYGGRQYHPTPPRTDAKLLHWKYGTKRESLPVKKRKEKPYRSFQTNNFLTTRSLLMRFPFDETLKNYGYEDLLMAQTLKNEGIKIEHIDNPLIHKGVEYTDDFLEKTKLAAANLAYLYATNQLSNTKMIDFHEKLKKIGFNSFLHKLIRRKKDSILKNLRSSNPNLFLFDLYRYDIFATKLSSL